MKVTALSVAAVSVKLDTTAAAFSGPPMTLMTTSAPDSA
jgi:hypothetical protein